jgi:copper(I)-binding protein
MMHVEEGFAVPAGGMHMLARGGDHVMLMGLNQSLAHGDVVSVTLTFEQAGDVTVDIPVDLERKPDHGAMDHSGSNTGG